MGRQVGSSSAKLKVPQVQKYQQQMGKSFASPKSEGNSKRVRIRPPDLSFEILKSITIGTIFVTFVQYLY